MGKLRAGSGITRTRVQASALPASWVGDSGQTASPSRGLIPSHWWDSPGTHPHHHRAGLGGTKQLQKGGPSLG